jgi:hypothetical protein
VKINLATLKLTLLLEAGAKAAALMANARIAATDFILVVDRNIQFEYVMCLVVGFSATYLPQNAKQKQYKPMTRVPQS